MKDTTKTDPLAAVLATVLLVPASLLKAVVVAAYWRWFALPLGLPPIGVTQALGLLLLSTVLLYDHTIQRAEKSALEMVTTSILMSLLMWGIGALWHWGLS